MRDSTERYKQALSVVHEQVIVELLESNPEGGSIRCGLVPDWSLAHDGTRIWISGPSSIEEHPKTPPWVNYTRDSDSFFVTAQIEPYLHETIGLILEAWQIKEAEPEEESEYFLREALLKIAERWKLSGEPLNRRQQKTLIGELRCVLRAHEVVGQEAVESWDPTGHQLHDIESQNWVIESKATNTEGIVGISYPQQVDYRMYETVVLGVTIVRPDNNGQTFPNFVRECLASLPKVSSSKLQTSLAGRGFTFGEEQKYSSKWNVEETVFHHITEDSEVMPCDAVDSFPKTVKKISYKLNTSDFPESSLSSLIGG